MEFNFAPEFDNAEAIPQQFRGLYVNADNKYKLRADDEGVKGAVEAITGLNRALTASRAEAKAAKGKSVDLSPLSEFGDNPTTILQGFQTKLQELQNELAKGDKAKLNLDKIKQELAEGHSKDLKSKDTRIQALTGQLYNLLVESSATSAIAEAKGVPTLLMPFLKERVKVVEKDGQQQVYVVDQAGDIRYSGVTGQPLSIKELVGEMKSDKQFGRLFESEQQAGGTGGSSGGGSVKPGHSGGGSQKEMTSTDKIKQGLAKRQFARV